MQFPHKKLSTDEATKLLRTLRDEPVTTQDAGDNILAPLLEFVQSSDRGGGVLHWFCGKAPPTVVEASVFLLRLFAYSSDRVLVWKKDLIRCLHGCCDCIAAFEDAKESSRTTYFGAFHDSVIREFWGSFERWEVEEIVRALNDAGVCLDSGNKTLEDAPTPLLYHLLSTPIALGHRTILQILDRKCQKPHLNSWPELPPPGCFLLLMHRSTDVRNWVKVRLPQVKPTPKERFSERYMTVLRLIIQTVASPTSSQAGGNSIASVFPFPSEPNDLWQNFVNVVRFVPREVLHSKANEVNLSRVVIGHLNDNASHFPTVLKLFIYILEGTGKELWTDESVQYPQVVFDSVKNNPWFHNLITTTDDTSKKPYLFLWFTEYLTSIWDLPVFEEVLARMTEFLLVELQHERFSDKRPSILEAALTLLKGVFEKVSSDEGSLQVRAISAVVDVHTDAIIKVALSREYSTPEWSRARTASHDLLRLMLLRDVDKIAKAMIHLTSEPKTVDDVPIVRPIQEQFWRKVYSNVQPNSCDGLGLILALCARGSKLDQLSRRAFQSRMGKFMSPSRVDDKGKSADSVELALNGINSALRVMREGFLDATMRCANMSSPSALLELFQKPGIVKHIIELLLSPVEDLHVGVQTIIGQAFDADLRSDCFRALLENSPQESLRGLQDYIEKFNVYAPQVIEACSVSKSLVQCLTDVIEVLGNSPDGLLLSEGYIKRNSSIKNYKFSDELLRLWKLMTNAIAVIFKRTPSWAPYFDNKMMIEWMRDALIFGRDLLSHRRAIENGILSARGEESFSSSPRKLSHVGKKMAMDLQDVLFNLHNWLRLTDPELLHQSFALTRSMLAFFKDTKIEPSKDVLSKLTAIVENGRKQGTARRTILDSVQLSQLQNDLAFFMEDEEESESDEDDVVVTGHVKPMKQLSLMDAINGMKNSQKTKGVVPAAKHVKLRPVEPRKPEKPEKPEPSSLRAMLQAQVAKRKKPENNRPSTSAAPETLPKSSSALQPSKTAPVASSTKASGHGRFIGGSHSRSVSRSSSAPPESDSSDDDDEEEGDGLESLAKLQKSPEKIKKTERRQIKVIDDPTVTAKTGLHKRLEAMEAARRQTMRLSPDITSLLRTILTWNYDHEGPEVPINGQRPQLQRISDRFFDPFVYRQTFEPLLLLECWAQILQSKDARISEIYECKIAGRQFVDDWLDIEAMINVAVRKDWRVTENDILLLRNSGLKRCIMARGSAFKQTFNGVNISLRCYLGPSGDPGLSINSVWTISQVFSLSTLRREYAALAALPYYDSVDTILQARLPPPAHVDRYEVEQTMKTYQVNEPQAKAIVASMNTEGFTLIQGPPGTGKTSTICGLIGAFISTRRPPATNITVGKSSGPPQKQPVKKVLICAPSNAAIDEVAKRLMAGVRDSRGLKITPKVVRVGTDRSMHHSVKEISLESLIDQRLSGEKKGEGFGQDITNEIASLRSQIATVKEDKQKKQLEMANTVNNAARALALETEFRNINSRWMSLSQRLNQLKDKQKAANRSADADRRRFRLEILDEADVICSTLSGSGHEILDKYEFEMIIIDEAAQSIELSSLIPLKYRHSRCIMVGDPNQLPPTVLSTEASKWGYDQSLFVRMQKQQPKSVHLLSIQYRMHPEISQLPSQLFYDGRLKDGPDMDTKTRKVWHPDERFGPYKFYSVKNGIEESAHIGHSLINKAECRVILALFDRLRREYNSFDFDGKIGIVSMYKAQVQELKKTFQIRYGPNIDEVVDFNTVDGFQGQEKDIIILSCVRAGTNLNTVGFLADVRRMNVAITRARSSLFIVGNAATLERSNEKWKNIVGDARNRSRFREVDIEYFRAPRDAPVPTVPTPKKSPTTKRQLSQASPDEYIFPVKKQKKEGSSIQQVPGDVVSAPTAVDGTQSSTSNEQTVKAQTIPVVKATPNEPKSTVPLKRPIGTIQTDGLDDTPAVPAKKTKDPEKALKALEKRRKEKQNNLFIAQSRR